jgi:AcrR family transcriptional regulator
MYTRLRVATKQNLMNSRSYVSPKRDAAAARTRERLLRAAAKLLRSPQGLAAMSLDSVARAAGVSRLTVYNQFGSRRGLLEAVFDERAERGGLHRLAEALSEPDPREGIARLIEIFCAFWSFDREPLGRLFSASAADPELRRSLRARNERRRKVLGILVGRLVARREVRAKAAEDLVDVLFALTAYSMFAELVERGRDTAEACRLIQMLAEGALAGAAVKQLD